MEMDASSSSHLGTCRERSSNRSRQRIASEWYPFLDSILPPVFKYSKLLGSRSSASSRKFKASSSRPSWSNTTARDHLGEALFGSWSAQVASRSNACSHSSLGRLSSIAFAPSINWWQLNPLLIYSSSSSSKAFSSSSAVHVSSSFFAQFLHSALSGERFL